MPAVPVNIRLGWKLLTVANTLPYYNMGKITFVKSHYVLAPGQYLVRIILEPALLNFCGSNICHTVISLSICNCQSIHPSLIFVGKAWAYRTQATYGWLPAMLANIRLGWKLLTVENTLPNYNMEKITAVKSFYVLAPVLHLLIHLLRPAL